MSKATALGRGYVLAGAMLWAVAVGFALQPANAEILMWEEDFADVGDWETFQTTIVSDGDIGTITADANNWGCANPIPWTTAQFGCGPHTDSLYVVCTAVSGRFKLNIMEEIPPYTEVTLVIGDAPGTYAVDLGDLTGWIGLKSFKIKIWVEWAEPGSASFDEIRVVNVAGWADDFEPIAAGWRDENTDPGFNATINDQAGPYAVVQELPGVSWGKVLSPVITVNVDDAPTLTAVVQSDPEMSNFLFGIQQEEPPYAFHLLGRGYDAGIFVYDYKGITGWSGVHAFSIQVGVESMDIDGWVVLDSIKLDCSEAPPVSVESETWGKVKALFK